MQVFVRNLAANGAEIPVEVPDGSTVHDLKAEIGRKCGDPVASQRLFHKERLLDNDEAKLADFYNADEGPIVKRFQILVKTITNKTYPIDVESLDYILSVKLLIQNALGVRVPAQRLYRTGPLDDDSKTLEECGIGPGHTISMVPYLNMIKLIIQNLTGNGTSTAVEVPGLFKVSKLRALLEHQYGVRVELTYNGTLLNDDETLDESGLKSDDEIVARKPVVVIFVKNLSNGLQRRFEVDLTWTVTQFKVKVREQFGDPPESGGYRHYNQQLFHRGKLLREEETLDHYNIKPGDTLYRPFRCRG